MQRKRMPLFSPAYGQVMGALRARSEGKVLDAFLRTERLLSQLAFNRGRPRTVDALEAIPLGWLEWRSKVMQTLEELSAEVDGETVEAWATRVKVVFERQASALAGTHEKLGTRFRKAVEGSKNVFTLPATDYLPSTEAVATSRISKVHQVKGQEFPAVCVYVPADRRDVHPADAILLTTEDTPLTDTMSARRVLYVGMTRAPVLLVVAVPNAWIPELESTSSAARSSADSIGAYTSLGPRHRRSRRRHCLRRTRRIDSSARCADKVGPSASRFPTFDSQRAVDRSNGARCSVMDLSID